MIQLTNIDFNFLSSIDGWMTEIELVILLNLAMTVNSWTELGTYKGRSAFAVALGLPYRSRLQLIDANFKSDFFYTLEHIKFRRPDLNIVICNSLTWNAISILEYSDVVFVDADHNYEAVKKDINIWKDKCKIICGHDYIAEYVDENSSHPGVKKAVDEIFGDKVKFPGDSIWIHNNE